MKFITAKDLLCQDVEQDEPCQQAEEKKSRKKEKTPPSANSVALRLLSLADHSSLQLREKLSVRGFSNEEIEETLCFLKEKRLLNDLRFGENLICYLAERKFYGAYKIRMELPRKLDREYIDQLLPHGLEQFDFPKLARTFAEKAQNRGKSREQMIRLLKARGYAVKDIRYAVEGDDVEPS